MATNDEIKEKYGFRKSSFVYGYVLEHMLNEARADTAKQIFKEIESTGILLMGRGYTESEKKYKALKKKQS
jgi:hypothetical protein